MMNVRFAGESDLPAVSRFNSRLKAGGVVEEMPMDPSLPGEMMYRPEGFPIYRRMIIAEDGQEIRAAMLLCHHNLFINGECRPFCWTKLPLSEGKVDAKYSLAIIQLIRKALEYQPFMMGVGAGTPDSDGYRLFSKLRWRYQSIPFFFYPVNATAVLRRLRYLKREAKLRYGSMLAAYSGAGAIISGLLAVRRRLSGALYGYEYSEIERFDEWADRIFFNSLSEYPVAIRSDAASLNIVYPPDDRRYARIRVKRKGTQADAGWIVVAAKQMVDNHYFGDLKVGTLVDGFGPSGDVPGLVAAGVDRLIGMGVDIIVANFSHAAWVKACRICGMFSGPSNFQIFVSPQGGPLLEESCPLDHLHVARGHSDGMDNLI